MKLSGFSVFSLFLVCVITLSCNSSQKNNAESKQTIIESNKDNLLFIGNDTVKLKPLYDTVACEVAHFMDTTGRFKTKGLTILEATRKDTVFLKNYGFFYGTYPNDCYNDCECTILDTTHYPLKFLRVSRFLGKITPELLIKNIEARLEMSSALGTYKICNLRFKQYCLEGKCYTELSEKELPFNDIFKSALRMNFQKKSYLMLNLIVAQDQNGNYVRINPYLCWYYD